MKGEVCSSIFRGWELVPFGSQHLQKLRVLISNAILRFSSCRNSALSIEFMPGLLDPAVALTYRAILASRQFLLRNDVSVHNSFFDKLARHSGLHHDCRGPIGVLKFDLQKFCWQTTTRTVVWQSPHEEFIRMCHHLHPEAVIDESLMGKIRRLSELSPVTFSTDGSCHFPHHKTSRFAALMSLLPMTNVEIWPNSSNLLDAFPIPYKSLQWHAPQVHTSFGTLCT